MSNHTANPHPDTFFVAVAGNIGVGKSSLTRLIADELNWEPFFEAVDENPYLVDFYDDMAQWSFHSQVYFLSRRLQHHRQLLDFPGHVIQDRSVYEDAEIFARNLFQRKQLSRRDYKTYLALYDGIRAFLPPPDLLIYLKASVGVLAERISARGREFERTISIAYLSELNHLYDKWAASTDAFPVYVIDTSSMDFVHNADDFKAIMDGLRDKLHQIKPHVAY